MLIKLLSKWTSKVRNKLLLIVIGSILVTTLPALAIIYYFSKQSVLTSESNSLISETDRLISITTQRFEESETKLKSLAKLLEMALEPPIQINEISEFNRLMEINPDGVYRNKKPPYNGKYEAGIFLPPNKNLNDIQKIEHIRMKKVFDIFGSAATRRFENVYYLSIDKSEIAMDRNKPDYVFEMQADLDYTQTPWVQLGNPSTNPNRELKFTPPLYEPVWNNWMVSAIYPIYHKDKWIGTIGEDMQLTNALSFIFESSSRHSEEQHFLIDVEGNFILAGNWQQLLEKDFEKFKSEIKEESQLNKLFDKNFDSKSKIISKNVIIDEINYLAIGIKLNYVDWKYIRLIPTNQILSSMQLFFVALLGVIILMSIIMGVMISFVSSKTISQRIMHLAKALDNFSTNENKLSPELLKGNDEISFAANSFVKMTEELKTANEKIQNQIKELYDAEQKYRSLVDYSQSVIYSISLEGVLTYVSPSWKELLGHENDEVVGKRFQNFIHNEDIIECENLIKRTYETKEVQSGVQYRIICKDGSLKWHRSVLTPVFDNFGNLINFVGNAVDITNVVIYQKTINEKNKELEQVIYVTSHDLRSPLVNVDGYTSEFEFFIQDLKKILETENSNIANVKHYLTNEIPELEKSLGYIKKSTYQMDKMLKGLLKLSRVGRMVLDIKNINMNNLIENIKSSFEYRIKTLNASIDVSDLPNCKGDSVQLTQLFTNLIENAFKYHNPNIKLIIKISGEIKKYNSVYCVEDNGIGIALEKKEIIFELFHRLDPVKTEGEGIGLTIVKNIVNRLGGSVNVESELGKGSKFFITLPYSNSEE